MNGTILHFFVKTPINMDFNSKLYDGKNYRKIRIL